MLGVSVRKVTALTVKMETVTLTGRGINSLIPWAHQLMPRMHLSLWLIVQP
jgi:hypothetical protein